MVKNWMLYIIILLSAEFTPGRGDTVGTVSHARYYVSEFVGGCVIAR